MIRLRLLFFAALLAPLCGFAQPKFELHDGDRVVFIGDTLIEREQHYGYIELALTTHFADRKITFRNLGWSADTPEGDSRFGLSLLQAGHEPSDEGWKGLLSQIELTKPTVVFLGYGMANSFDGEKGLPKFVEGLNKLIDAISEKMKGDVRFVLLSPIRHENLGAPLPDPKAHNQQLALYSRAIQEIATKRNIAFVSLFDDLKMETERKASHPLTDNGIHLNKRGYQEAAAVIEKSLGWKPGKWKSGPRAEKVREAIVTKNEIFFNRSRPQNMAYLFGFRKHEQGQNAGEIQQFDALADKADEKIRELLAGHKVASTKKSGAIPAFQKSPPLPMPKFELAPGLEVNLFAENPLLAKPIQMNFDPQGRLWTASSAIYPQVAPGQEPIDKIIVIEDKNGDGVADKSSVFVDGLQVPTAVVPGDGGVYVGQSTELLFFKDTNGDGKADERKIVISSFGTEDSHHNVHTLRWGPDGQLFFNQSIYIRTDAETPNGVVRLKSGGVFNLNPSSMEMDVFIRGLCNAWGHAFDPYGQSFISDGCGSQGICYGIRGATFWTYANLRRELKSISPGSYPKFCGLEILRSEHFPAEWQDNFITSDFRAHRVTRFKVTEDGAGFAAQELPEIMRSTDATFRPIDAKVGPDGALYIADWSNPIINHGEVDFRDPRRDHEHGRIWRVTAKGRPLLKKPALVSAKNISLFEQLTSSNDFNRNEARRVLTERGQKIKGDLAKWIETQTNERALLEALWTYQSIGSVEPKLLQKVLAAKDGRVRAGAVRVLSFWLNDVSNASDLLAKAVADAHPRVRLEAVRALAKIPSARSAELVLSAVDKPMDSFLDYGIWLSINELVVPWIQAVQNGQWKADGKEKQLEFGIKAVEPQFASVILQKALGGRALLARDGSPWIELIGYCGGKTELRALFDQVAKNDFNESASVRALNALNDAAKRDVIPEGDLAGLDDLFTSSHEKIKTAAIRLAGTWKLKKLTASLLVAVNDKSTNVQTAAFESLRQIGGDEVAGGLGNLLQKNEILSRNQAALTLASLNFEKALPYILKIALVTTNEAAAADFWRSVLANKDAGLKIARELPGEIPVAVAKLALKVAREGGRNESELVLALTRAANLDDADKELTAAEMKQLAEEVSGKGDPSRGEKIYRRADVGCVTCHAIGGAGGKVGPDMTSIGASAPVDYLIESVLFPNKKIKEGFHSLQVTTRDEQEFSGVLVRETDADLVLRDATNKEISIQKKNIQSRKNGNSLMPTGLMDNLKSDERIDLIRFLSELGRPGPFDASKGNVARAWKIFVLTVNNEQFGTEKIMAGDTGSSDWTPVFTTVAGRLGKETLETQLKPVAARALGIFGATKFQLSGAENVKFKIETPGLVELWVDGKSLGKTRDVVADKKANGETEISAQLTQGKHAVIVKMDPKSLPETVRLELSHGTFLIE